MKNLIDYAMNVDRPLLVACMFIFIAFIMVVYDLSTKLIYTKKDKKMQSNPLSLGLYQINSFFKILEVNEEKGIALLGYNPSAEYPLGIGKAWFKIDNIPKEFCRDGTVLKVVIRAGAITCDKWPLF